MPQIPPEKLLHMINTFSNTFINNNLKVYQVINLTRKLEVLYNENFKSLK